MKLFVRAWAFWASGVSVVIEAIEVLGDLRFSCEPTISLFPLTSDQSLSLPVYEVKEE